MKTKLLLICIVLFLGCQQDIKRDYTTREDLQSVRDNLKENTDNITLETKNIQKETSNINQETDSIEEKIPLSDISYFGPHLQSIRRSSFNIYESCDSISQSVGNIKETDDILKISQSDISSMERDINIAIRQRDKAIEQRDSQIRKMLNSLIISCIIGAGVFTVIFFLTGSKIGLVLSISCVIIISLAFFVEAYLSYIALVGAGFFVLLIGMLIYYAFQQKRNFEKERKALREVIHTVEVTKYNLPKENKEKLFGDKDNNGVMDIIQSKETMEAIKQIRDEMPALWRYILEEEKD